jgi:hypothetical protein
MSNRKTDPVRLRDVPAAFDTSGVHAAELFQAASVQPQFHDAQVELLLRRTRAAQRKSAWGRLRLFPALTSLPVLMFGMTVGAATTVMITRNWSSTPTKASTLQIAKVEVVVPKVTRAQPLAGTPVAPPDEPAPLTPTPVVVRAKRAATQFVVQKEEAPQIVADHPAIAEEPIAPDPSSTEAWALPPSAEAQLIREAVRTLRIDRRPALALDMLEEFQRTYARSDLSIETKMLSAEAHLALGQRKEALAALNAVASSRNLPTELALLRAELLADAHRCTEASAVFMGLESATLLSPQQERVLYGQAVCLAEKGDSARARTAYLKYQNRFPHGRFAQSVTRALGGTTNNETSP